MWPYPGGRPAGSPCGGRSCVGQPAAQKRRRLKPPAPRRGRQPPRPPGCPCLPCPTCGLRGLPCTRCSFPRDPSRLPFRLHPTSASVVLSRTDPHYIVKAGASGELLPSSISRLGALKELLLARSFFPRPSHLLWFLTLRVRYRPASRQERAIAASQHGAPKQRQRQWRFVISPVLKPDASPTTPVSSIHC